MIWAIYRIANSVETWGTSWNNNEYNSADNILVEIGTLKLSTEDK